MKEYFSHDYNARNDTKLVKVFMKHGLQGIGAYWCIIEMLFEESGYLIRTEYERIAFELRTEYDTIKSIVENYELFEFDDTKFWSNSALDRLEQRMDKSAKARASVEKRWAKHKNDTNVLQSNNERNTSKVKESKVKEISFKDSFNLFWDYYHKTTGKEKTDKVPAFKYWKKLTINEQRKAYSSVKSYLSTVKDKQYLKKARTYLADKNFNDEVANDNGLKYLNEQDKINRGLNPKREYIFSKVDGSDYAGLLNDKEKLESGLDVNKVYTLQNNLVV